MGYGDLLLKLKRPHFPPSSQSQDLSFRLFPEFDHFPKALQSLPCPISLSMMSSGSQLAWLSVALHTTAGVREFLGYLANLLAELESPIAWQLPTSSLQLPLLLLTPATVLLPALGVTPSLPSQPSPDLTCPLSHTSGFCSDTTLPVRPIGPRGFFPVTSLQTTHFTQKITSLCLVYR